MTTLLLCYASRLPDIVELKSFQCSDLHILQIEFNWKNATAIPGIFLNMTYGPDGDPASLACSSVYVRTPSHRNKYTTFTCRKVYAWQCLCNILCACACVQSFPLPYASYAMAPLRPNQFSFFLTTTTTRPGRSVGYANSFPPRERVT